MDSKTFYSVPRFPSIDVKDIICRLIDDRNDTTGTKAFALSNYEVDYLVKQAISIISSEPPLLRLSSPINIIGSVYGQFKNVLNYIEECGPLPDMKYLFLGDYLHNPKSYETICLLLAMKIEFPDQIWILRGEEKDLNIQMANPKLNRESKKRFSAFSSELATVSNLLNNILEWLPLAAVVDDEVFCSNTGIPRKNRILQDILKLERPACLLRNEIVKDILWSLPYDSDDVKPRINYCFHENDLNKFLSKNNFKFMIRSHDSYPKGYKLFNKPSCQLITIFSAFNSNNFKASILTLKRNLLMYLHIFPSSDEDLSSKPKSMYTHCFVYKNDKLVEDEKQVKWQQSVSKMPTNEQYLALVEREFKEINKRAMNVEISALKKPWINLERDLVFHNSRLSKQQQQILNKTKDLDLKTIQQHNQLRAWVMERQHLVEMEKLRDKQEREKIYMKFECEFFTQITQFKLKQLNRYPVRKIMPGLKYREFRTIASINSIEENIDLPDYSSDSDENDCFKQIENIRRAKKRKYDEK